MVYWLLQRVLYRGFRSRRGIIGMRQLDALAGADTGAWALAQERARLDYLAAKEEYERLRSWRSFQRLLERLLGLHSTNAIIQSLINEQLLALLAARSDTPLPDASATRKCA
jgi:hypothetical protein